MVNDGEQFRLGFTPSLSTLTEIGQVDNFVDDLDDLIDLIDDPSLNKDPVQTVLDRFNSILVKMGDEGYVKIAPNYTCRSCPCTGKCPMGRHFNGRYQL